MSLVEAFPTEKRKQNILTFFLIVTLLLVCFLLGEWVFEEFILLEPLSYSQRLLLTSILYIIIFVIILTYARRTGTSEYDMGFHTLYLPKSIVIGFLATSGYLIAVVAFQLPLKYDPIISSAYPSILDILILFGFTFLIGLSEEGAFRGYIQANYLKVLSQFKAIVLTAILFAFLHIPSYVISGNYYSIASLPSLILVGLLLGYIRIHTGNIWGVVIAHGTWDFYMFLFAPAVDLGAPISELIPLLVASGAMWGSIILSMVVAKKWVDRPEQIPAELEFGYSQKIRQLLKKNWDLQQMVSNYRIGGMPYHSIVEKYTNRIQMNEESIAFLKEVIPLINKSTYKIIRKLVPLKLKAIKLQNLMKFKQYAYKIPKLEQDMFSLQEEMNPLEAALGINNNFIAEHD